MMQILMLAILEFPRIGATLSLLVMQPKLAFLPEGQRGGPKLPGP